MGDFAYPVQSKAGFFLQPAAQVVLWSVALAIAQRDPVERNLGELLLDHEDRRGARLRLRRRSTGEELEELLDVGDVLRARLDEAGLGLQVVVAVRQPEASRRSGQ